jgi:phage terminase Nu1 subunit (DNA packaging protein)
LRRSPRKGRPAGKPMPDASLQQMAELLGVTNSAAKRLANEGLLVRSARGRFNVERSVRKYAGHLRNVASNKSESPSARALIRAKEAQARLAEVKTRHLEEDFIEMRVAHELMAKFAAHCKAAFLQLPSRIRVKMGLTIPQEDQIEDIVFDRMEELYEELKSRELVDDPKPRAVRIPLNKRNSDKEVSPL